LEIRQHPGVFKAEVSWGCKIELWEYIVGVPKCQLSCFHFCHVLTEVISSGLFWRNT